MCQGISGCFPQSQASGSCSGLSLQYPWLACGREKEPLIPVLRMSHCRMERPKVELGDPTFHVDPM